MPEQFINRFKWVVPYTIALASFIFAVSGFYWQTVLSNQKVEQLEKELEDYRDEMKKEIEYVNGRLDRKIKNHEEKFHK